MLIDIHHLGASSPSGEDEVDVSIMTSKMRMSMHHGYLVFELEAIG